MSPPPIAVSAPGKVLFAGGFLVLDRQHTGLVFGLNARIHAIARQRPSASSAEPARGDLNANEHTGLVEVESPQFRDARWLYRVGFGGFLAGGNDAAAVQVEQVRDREEAGFTASGNKFVETTLRYVLTYVARGVVPGGNEGIWARGPVKVTILADHDYYSQPANSGALSLVQGQSSSGTGEWRDFNVRLSEAHKTGLGSSAALVTSLVSALLAWYLQKREFGDETPLSQRTVHNLAQAAHCAAQGKVGSGFDVAAAVYGSCLYRRFTPTILENVGEPTSAGFGERLHLCVDDLHRDSKWDVEVASQAVRIPQSLLLVMCDVDCGSETPGMVKKVLQWRKERTDEATLLWNALQQGQEELCRELRQLAAVEAVDSDFTALRDIILTIRSLVREMSVKSGVPIEPPVITELLDFCSSIPGVVGGVAPGAGGYDAVALLLRNDPGVLETLRARLEGWKSQDDTGAEIGNVKLLGVKQENDGVRIEDGDRYRGWTD
ncbi:phosphomevalonate kinase [Cladophialophora carrionii CBS 160.54]|uniref:Phosphomevalonate kinase n=1 Tax=Cladophialophora carrionii CBS 160.54 TaxID=1279043 RepID=V9D3E2_9EURO|nr:phosphomevalonate kinase [Cladophialophora carrionii CBS 160.54]ETI21186.1 phosphomevalonate kinase [Cladophialophora carrionii CBS 160.54]